MIYRKHVRHASRKNFQLDLSLRTTATSSTTPLPPNMTLALPTLFAFVCGRGAQEKTLAEARSYR
jgi:hypothetical protein